MHIEVAGHEGVRQCLAEAYAPFVHIVRVLAVLHFVGIEFHENGRLSAKGAEALRRTGARAPPPINVMSAQRRRLHVSPTGAIIVHRLGSVEVMLAGRIIRPRQSGGRINPRRQPVRLKSRGMLFLRDLGGSPAFLGAPTGWALMCALGSTGPLAAGQENVEQPPISVVNGHLELLVGGQQNCPPVATETARSWPTDLPTRVRVALAMRRCSGLAHRGDSLPGEGLGKPDRVARGLAEVGVVQQPVDGGGGEGFGHELVEPGRVQV